MCEECAEESQLYARDLFLKLRGRIEELELRVKELEAVAPSVEKLRERVAAHENVLTQEVL